MGKLQAKYVVQNNDVLRTRIPEDTLNNLPLFYAQLKENPKLMNAFLTDLIDKVGITSLVRQNWRNPLEIFSKGGKPLGRFIENIHVNPVKAEPYKNDATTLLNIRKPDVASEYYQMNRQDKYPITINKPMIQQAFVSWESLDDLIDNIVNSIYTGNYIDEWVLTRNLLSSNVENMVTDELENSDDLAKKSKEILKKLKYYSKAISDPSTNYNMFTKEHQDNARITWVAPEDQCILIRSDVLIDIDVEYLAGVFNLSKVEPDKQIISIPTFTIGENPDKPEIQAIICDKNFLKSYDDLTELRDFDNPETLNFTYFYHVWQTMGLSKFANHVALVNKAAAA